MKVGIPKSALLDGFHPDVLKAYREALEIYRKLGAAIVEVDMPSSLDAADEAQRIIRISEAAAYHAPFLAHKADRYGDASGGAFRPRRDAEAGSLVTAVQYLQAQRVRKIFMKQMELFFQDIDLLVTPGRPAPAGEPARVKQDFQRMFNLNGYPALALPAGFSTSPPGLPVGLQIAGRPFEEETIYRAAYAYEAETRWHTRRPPI
jgi:aspartyl-tRNA(Asn)/glutamyl-tRNA(Gln) amidotransferase subunit A